MNVPLLILLRDASETDIVKDEQEVYRQGNSGEGT